jgi:NADH:ubiquinone oxidoreductase subunit 2 (subunit N)
MTISSTLPFLSSVLPAVLPPFVLVVLALVLPSTAERLPLAHRLSSSLLIFGVGRGRGGTAVRSPFSSVSAFSSDLVRTTGDITTVRNDLISPRFALLIRGTLRAGALAATAHGPRDPQTDGRGAREFPLLALLLLLGALLALTVSTARDLFLALERVTLSSYVLVASARHHRFSTYAGVQYFLLGAVPSAALVLAFALLYRQTGALAIADLDLLASTVTTLTVAGTAVSGVDLSGTSVSQLAEAEVVGEVVATSSFLEQRAGISSTFPLETLLATVSPLAVLPTRALVFLLTNLFFKRTAAPVQFWAPSVYGKAPLPAVAVLATLSKARALLVLLALLRTVFAPLAPLTTPILLVVGILSVRAGRLGAFGERETKRFLVYSSRGHVGFRLLGVALSRLVGIAASLHYLPVYLASALLS